MQGTDLNAASAEDLSRRVDGIGQKLADSIVANRTRFGPFTSIHDLGRVPGMGPTAFTRITSQPWREDAQARRQEVLDIVGGGNEFPNVGEVAQRFADVSGFAGCLIADADGELLAESWSDEKAVAIGAYAPHVIQKISPMLSSLEKGSLDMMTLFISEQAYSLIPYKNLVFVAIHEMNRFSRKQLRIAQQVTDLLGASLLGPR